MKDFGRLRAPEDSRLRRRRRSRFRSSIAQCLAGPVCEEISSTVANAAKRLLKQATVTPRLCTKSERRSCTMPQRGLLRKGYGAGVSWRDHVEPGAFDDIYAELGELCDWIEEEVRTKKPAVRICGPAHCVGCLTIQKRSVVAVQIQPFNANIPVELLAIWWVAFPGIAGIAEMGAVRNLRGHTIVANRQKPAVALPVGSG